MAGKSDFRASNFYDPVRDAYGTVDPTRSQGKTGYDPNAKRYGGSAEASAAAEHDRAAEADRAQSRTGVQLDKSQSNYAAQQADYARQEQGAAMGLMRARATGQAPSIAQMQADRQMDQARSAQTSAAASARGPAGLAMAQQGAAANMAAAQQGISGQAQIAAAQERQAAEQAYFGAASGIRGGDVSQQQLYAQQAGAQAQLDAQQRAANDAKSMFYDQGSWDVNNRNQDAAMREQAILSGAHGSADSQNAQTNRENAHDKFGWKDAMGAVGGLASAGIGLLSDVRSKENIAPIMPDPMTHSLQAMKPYAYEYKQGRGAPGQNVGPMAQEMAQNPITATAIMPDPQTGMLAIDRDKALKVTMGGVGHLAAKQAEMERKLSRVKGGK